MLDSVPQSTMRRFQFVRRGNVLEWALVRAERRLAIAICTFSVNEKNNESSFQ